MKLKRIKKAKDHEWLQPKMKGFVMACCDCGLVHKMDFRIVNENVQFKAVRAPRYTAAQRKKRGATAKGLGCK